MRRLLLTLGRLVLVVAIFTSGGGHWAILQSIAWGRMLVNNTRDSSFLGAVEKTFDGRHPCEICKGIAAAKEKEQKQQQTILISKAPLLCPESGIDQCVMKESPVRTCAGDELLARSLEPAIPPPRPIV
ncbi:MAG TPA: hypothetical protein VGH90_06210 [Chthoniobacteraceae bacterium]